MSDWSFLNKHRVRRGPFGSDDSIGFNGMFEFALPGEARKIRCIASDGAGWRHVSVSFGPTNRSCPSRDLMCRVKDMFWTDEDCVVQFHPPKADYVNNHAGCLHLWQKLDGSQPIPDSILVGIKGLECAA